MKEARFYEKLEGKKVRCSLCPRHCVIAGGRRGNCRTRLNRGGTLYAANYGLVNSPSADPIEKKPLFHFHPGAHTLSFCTAGCNMHCTFCQNWKLSQAVPGTINEIEMAPEQMVGLAKQHNLRHISYTYTEPTVFYEYAIDTMRLAHDAGIKNSWVSNGFIEEKPLKEVIPYLDAVNMDFKMSSRAEYAKYCGADAFDAVKRTAKILKKGRVHLELTTLIIPGVNDNLKDLEGIFDFIAGLDKTIPLHLSRFYPHYKMKGVDPTPLKTLALAADMAGRKLDYVYIGNAPEIHGEDTFCPECKTLLIKRTFYSISDNNLKGGKCPKCGKAIPVIE